MDCEQGYFSVIFPLSMAGFALYNYSNIISFLLNGTGKGVINILKRNVTVDTTTGKVSIPSVKLPSMDWEVHLFNVEESNVSDGMHSLKDVEEIDTLECKIRGRTLLCEIIYPEELGVNEIRGYISSIFDDECYVFTVKQGEMIDYRKFSNNFMLDLEDL